MKEKISDFIIPIGILFLGYTVMQKLFPGSTQGTGQPSSTATKECPRSLKYSITPLQMITGGCDAGYTKETDWFGLYTGNCVCNSPSTPPVNSPPGSTPPASTPPTPSTPTWWDRLFAPAAPAETVPSTPMPLTDPAVWSIYHPTPFVQPPGTFQPIAGQGLTGIAGLDYLQNRISGDFGSSTPAPTVSGGGGGGGDGTYTSASGQTLTRSQAQAAGIID